MSRVLVAVLAVLAVACGAKAPPVVSPTVIREKEPYEVKVPAPYVVPYPPELVALLGPLKIPMPKFISPSDPRASSALTVEDERLMQGLLWEYVVLRNAVRAHYESTKGLATLPLPALPGSAVVPAESEKR